MTGVLVLALFDDNDSLAVYVFSIEWKLFVAALGFLTNDLPSNFDRSVLAFLANKLRLNAIRLLLSSK